MSIVRKLAHRQATMSHRVKREDMERLKVRLERELDKFGENAKLRRRLAEVEQALETGCFE